MVDGEIGSHGRSRPEQPRDSLPSGEGTFVKVRHESIRMKQDLAEFKDDKNDDFDVVRSQKTGRKEG